MTIVEAAPNQWYLVNGDLRHYTWEKGKVFGPWHSREITQLEMGRVEAYGLEADECWARTEEEAVLIFTLRSAHGL